MRQLRISQCMIVKNEEKNIRQALAWGKDIMWEQIVVDTGSTDQTVEIAQEMGAAVYSFSWSDDFSAAKNFACSKAKGNWIVFLDADEYMDEENGNRLKALLIKLEQTHSPTQAILTNWFNVNEEGEVFTGGNQMRVFRNFSGVRYQGRIHEYLVRGKRALTAEEVLDACDKLTIYHTGYTKQALAAGQKLERNRRLILKELEEQPDDYMMLGNMADICRASGEYEQAIEWYEKAMDALPPEEEVAQSLNMKASEIFAWLLLLLCNEKKKVERILSVYEKAIRYVKEDSDFDYVLGKYFAESGDFWKGALHLQRALDLFEQNGTLCTGMMLTGNLTQAWEYLAICCFNTGQKDRCVSCCITLLQTERFNLGILKLLLSAFGMEARTLSPAQSKEMAKQVLSFLEKLYQLSELKDRIFVWKAARETGYSELTIELNRWFSLEELEILEKK